MADRIVRYGELVRAKPLLLMRIRQEVIRRKILLLLVEVFQRAPINMFTLLFRMASILVQQVNHQMPHSLHDHNTAGGFLRTIRSLAIFWGKVGSSRRSCA